MGRKALDPGLRRDDGAGGFIGHWIPACAGMTAREASSRGRRASIRPTAGACTDTSDCRATASLHLAPRAVLIAEHACVPDRQCIHRHPGVGRDPEPAPLQPGPCTKTADCRAAASRHLATWAKSRWIPACAGMTLRGTSSTRETGPGRGRLHRKGDAPGAREASSRGRRGRSGSPGEACVATGCRRPRRRRCRSPRRRVRHTACPAAVARRNRC